MLKDQIISAMEAALDAHEDFGPREGRPPVRLEYARDEKFGDYASTIAMDKRFRELYSEAKPEFKNPRNFAAALEGALKAHAQTASLFANIDVAGPGFLNLTLAPEALADFAAGALDQPAEFGRA